MNTPLFRNTVLRKTKCKERVDRGLIMVRCSRSFKLDNRRDCIVTSDAIYVLE